MRVSVRRGGQQPRGNGFVGRPSGGAVGRPPRPWHRVARSRLEAAGRRPSRRQGEHGARGRLRAPGSCGSAVGRVGPRRPCSPDRHRLGDRSAALRRHLEQRDEHCWASERPPAPRPYSPPELPDAGVRTTRSCAVCRPHMACADLVPPGTDGCRPGSSPERGWRWGPCRGSAASAMVGCRLAVRGAAGGDGPAGAAGRAVAGWVDGFVRAGSASCAAGIGCGVRLGIGCAQRPAGR
jgi:hypothetical protein